MRVWNYGNKPILKLLIVAGLGLYLGVIIGKNLFRPETSLNVNAEYTNSYENFEKIQSAMIEGGNALNIESGQHFPSINVFDFQRNPYKLSDSLIGHRSLVIFCDLHPEFSLKLINHLESEVVPELCTDCHLFICFDIGLIDSVTSIYGKTKLLNSIVFFESSSFTKEYNLRVLPSLVSVDLAENVLVTQIGFYGILDKRFNIFVTGKKHVQNSERR